MTRYQNATCVMPRHDGARRKNRPVCPTMERLEARALLSTTPSVLSRTGTIDTRGHTGSVLLQVLPTQFTAPASGKIRFDVELTGADGSTFRPGSFVIVGPGGKRVLESNLIRSNGAVSRYASLAPGEYTVRVAGLRGSTGEFQVNVHLVGDVNGDRSVTPDDLSQVQQAIGTRFGSAGFNPALDLTHNGVVNRVDLAQARRNLGASAGSTFTFKLTDSTNNAFTPDQIYVTIIGSAGGRNVRLDASGNQHPLTAADNNGPGSITRNGLTYTPSYSMKLSTFVNSGITIGQIASARIWISLGAPLYFHVDAGGGHTQPDVGNPSDPNAKTYFDFAEFTLDGGGLHANTSQVDDFSIPLTMHVVGAKDQTVGITESRSKLFTEFASAVPAGFKNLVDPNGYRITSPKKSPAFDKNYYSAYIDQMWTYYQTHTLSIDTIFGTYVGKASGDTMTFKNAANGSRYNVTKPSSADVIGSTGSIVSGDETAKAIKARISAMINRHVATNASQGIPSEYYQAAPANYYSQFWHQHSIGGLAYGFDYDDVFNQSSSVIDANPSSMTINVTWN